MDTVEELSGFFQGETPDGFRLGSQPELDEDTAWSVIYVLQEKFGLITDEIEKCEQCGRLFEIGYDEKIVETADLRDPSIYPDLESIPDFSGIFCGEGCMQRAAQKYRQNKDSKTTNGDEG